MGVVQKGYYSTFAGGTRYAKLLFAYFRGVGKFYAKLGRTTSKIRKRG